MFTSLYYHTIESKGRLAIPKDFRNRLKSGSVITRGLDGCIFLFPASFWKQLSAKLASLPLTNASARAFIRLIVHQATPLNLDSQGRTHIPSHLQHSAHLKKNVVVAGALTRIEIWDRDLYHQHLDRLEQQFTTIQEKLAEFNI